MRHEPNGRDRRLVAIIDDDPQARAEYECACTAAGWRVVSTAIGSPITLANGGEACAVVLSLNSEGGLLLLQALADHRRTRHIPVIVPACHLDQARMRAEQTGTVMMFLDRPPPASHLPRECPE